MDSVSAVPRTIPVRSSRTAADWIGCAFFCAFAITLPLTSGRSGLLLLPPMLYEVVVAGTFLVRGQPRRTLPGIGPRVAAYGATFLIPVFLWMSARWAPAFLAPSHMPLLQVAGASAWLFGTVLSFWPIWYLRRSFSIEPAARELTLSGPYSFARHPIYATQIFEYAGIWMLHATIPLGLVLVAWLVVLRIRVGYEERVLSAEFDAYHGYRQRVWAFGPALLRPRSVRSG
jgi:protein-S-isoprenylcysteine O-methyltransferase Ste14